MLKILLSGCFGKMCTVIAEQIKNRNDMEVSCGVDMCRDMVVDFPAYTSFDAVESVPDVIIDFSNPSNLDDLLEYSLGKNIPVVIATTGYSEEQIAKIKAAAQSIPVFFTFNMSLGVNLLVNLAKTAAKVLADDFDIEIVEKHHNQKLDAPSGTAIMIADAINGTLGDKMNYEFDRHSKREKREKNEIGIHSIRGGTIVGEHDVIFAGKDEALTLSHTALSKGLFATGAIKAALYISKLAPGIYDMCSLLDF